MVVKANKHADGHRRPPGHLRLVGRAVRRRLQPLLPGQGRRPRRRRRLHPGPRRARHLRPGLPRGPPHRGAARRLPPRDRRRRPVELPAPAAHAGLLGVPDGVDGPRPARRRSTRPASTATCTSARSTTPPSRGCGASSATARPTSPRRSARSRWPGASASTTSSGSSTATSSGSTGRCGATARSSRSSRRSSGAPGGTSSRSSGARSGTSCWPRDVDGVLLDRMNDTVDGDFQRYATESRRLHPRPLLRPRPAAAAHGRPPHRRGAPRPAPRRPRLPEALRGLQGGHRADGRAHGHPGQDDQGVDARPRRRGPQRHPPDQEDDDGAAPRAARAPLPPRPDPRGGAGRRRRAAVLPAAGGLARAHLPDGSAPGPRRLAAQAGGAHQAAAHPARRRGVRRARRRLGQAGGVDHDGLHPPAADPGPRRGLRPADRADHPRRGPHLRHGLAVQGVRHLRGAGPEVRAGRPLAAAVLQGVHQRPAARGGHHRGRLDWRRGSPPAPPTPPAACRWCRSSPSTRCSGSSGSATSSGRPPTPGPGAS